MTWFTGHSATLLWCILLWGRENNQRFYQNEVMPNATYSDVKAFVEQPFEGKLTFIGILGSVMFPHTEMFEYSINTQYKLLCVTTSEIIFNMVKIYHRNHHNWWILGINFLHWLTLPKRKSVAPITKHKRSALLHEKWDKCTNDCIVL